jgi:hypothetical protein
VQGVVLNKHALNRAKLILELKQQQMRNSVAPSPNAVAMKADFSAGVSSPQEAKQILDGEITLLTAALTTNKLLKKFPAKTYQSGFQHQMQVTTDKAFDDICAVLGASDAELEKEQSKATLKAALIQALAPHFFSRTI